MSWLLAFQEDGERGPYFVSRQAQCLRRGKQDTGGLSHLQGKDSPQSGDRRGGQTFSPPVWGVLELESGDLVARPPETKTRVDVATPGGDVSGTG